MYLVGADFWISVTLRVQWYLIMVWVCFLKLIMAGNILWVLWVVSKSLKMCFVLFLFIWLGFGFGFVCLFAKFNAPLKLHTVVLSNFLSLALSCLFYLLIILFRAVSSKHPFIVSQCRTDWSLWNDRQPTVASAFWSPPKLQLLIHRKTVFPQRTLCGLLGSITLWVLLYWRRLSLLTRNCLQQKK